MLTRDIFNGGLIVLQSGINRHFTVETLETWYTILKDLDPADFEYAIERYLAESTNAWPQPAHIRQLAVQRCQPPALTAGEAWAAVLSADRTHSAYYNPGAVMAALDPLTAVALRAIGGTSALADLDADNRFVVAGQFRKAYETEAQRGETARLMPARLQPGIGYQPKTLESTPARLGDVIARCVRPEPGEALESLANAGNGVVGRVPRENDAPHAPYTQPNGGARPEHRPVKPARQQRVQSVAESPPNKFTVDNSN